MAATAAVERRLLLCVAATQKNLLEQLLHCRLCCVEGCCCCHSTYLRCCCCQLKQEILVCCCCQLKQEIIVEKRKVISNSSIVCHQYCYGSSMCCCFRCLFKRESSDMCCWHCCCRCCCCYPCYCSCYSPLLPLTLLLLLSFQTGIFTQLSSPLQPRMQKKEFPFLCRSWWSTTTLHQHN